MPEPTRQALEEQADRLAGALARRLANHRKRLGLTRKQLQELTGITERMQIFVERRERNLSVHSLVVLCLAMDLDVSTVIKEAEMESM